MVARTSQPQLQWIVMDGIPSPAISRQVPAPQTEVDSTWFECQCEPGSGTPLSASCTGWAILRISQRRVRWFWPRIVTVSTPLSQKDGRLPPENAVRRSTMGDPLQSRVPQKSEASNLMEFLGVWREHARGRLNGGEGGIRTPDSLATMPDFESGAFNRALPPLRFVYNEIRPGGNVLPALVSNRTSF